MWIVLVLVVLKIAKIILMMANSLWRHMQSWTMIQSVLQPAVQSLKLKSVPETLPLQTDCHYVLRVQGASVSLEISPFAKPSQRYWVHHAFTADHLGLSEHSYPVKSL